MAKIKIIPEGVPNEDGNAWGYCVKSPVTDEEYSVRAWPHDHHYLLEEGFGTSEQKPFHLFDFIELSQYQQADKILFAKAKERAEKIKRLIISELTDKIQQIPEHKKR